MDATRNSPDDPFKEMHLLDSFLTEVSRLHPPDACNYLLTHIFYVMLLILHLVTVQRKVLRSYTLPSGIVIPPGNLVAVLSLPNPVTQIHSPIPTSLTVVVSFLKTERLMTRMRSHGSLMSVILSPSGAPHGKPGESVHIITHAVLLLIFRSPGRWYVSETLKQAMVHLLLNYDFKVENKPERRYLYWTTAIFPRPNEQILLKPRSVLI
jgi:hypothetical protein